MTPTNDALRRLLDGNRRFVEGRTERDSSTFPERRRAAASNQRPFAAILGCADSRVPPELVFDQGLGDLFTVRVAGNIAAPTAVGGLEFAVEQLGVRLIVVLGHRNCGAVESTLNLIRNPSIEASPNLETIVRQIRPAVESTIAAAGPNASRAPNDLAEDANVRAVVTQLRAESRLAPVCASDGLRIVGAVVDIASGQVELLDN